MQKKINTILKPFLAVVVLVLIWWLLFALKIWPAWLFPSPMEVGKTFIKGFANHTFIWGILISLKRLMIGFVFSLIIGSILGLLIAKSRFLKETINPLILGLQTLPSVCWLPLALLWFGLNERAIIFVIIMGTFLSLTISVKNAVLNLQPALINAGKMLGASGFNLYRYIFIPAILPSYVTGLQHAWTFAWRSLMNGEMLFISIGLGQLLMFGRELNDMSQVMAVMLVIIIIGVIFDQLIFGKMEKSLRRRWGLAK